MMFDKNRYDHQGITRKYRFENIYFVMLQESNWNILRNLIIEENDFLRKYKERRQQHWKQVAGHSDSFIEGYNEVIRKL